MGFVPKAADCLRVFSVASVVKVCVAVEDLSHLYFVI